LDIILSDHAVERSEQCNLSYKDIEFVVQYGTRLYNAGAVFCQLHDKDIPTTLAPNHRSWQLVGTTVLLCSHCGQSVITVYRNEKAFRGDRHKSKKCLKLKHRCRCGALRPQVATY
jgi:hypothetical protein